MHDTDVPATLRAELLQELTGHLLPFWFENAFDLQYGGFVGQISQTGEVVHGAAKGAVLNARILWTFSAAARHLDNPMWLNAAERAFDYLDDHFWDAENGGVYWSVDYVGRPLEPRKQIYAQAFALYGLTEYYRATKSEKALERSRRLFELIEEHAYDPDHGGYFEAFGADWGPLSDVRLSRKDLNAPKSMNTHLHVLEAYTNLARIWEAPLLRERLGMLVELFLDRIIERATGHLDLFFGRDWEVRSDVVSFGHDVETSWLLLEAVDVLGDDVLYDRALDASIALARSTLEEGQDADGGIFNEILPGTRLDADKHWWPQAEAIVGFLQAYQSTGDAAFLTAALSTWAFVKNRVIDRKGGEWYGRLNRAGVPYEGEDKVGMWKCPYHNVRACLEVMARVDGLRAQGEGLRVKR